MPHKRKVYQKSCDIKEKIALMKIFFWPLYVISRHFYGLSTIRIRHGCPVFESERESNTPAFFSFKSLLRIGQPRSGTRAQQRGSRQVRGLAPSSPLLALLEDDEMKNPEYFRLMLGGRFIGFKRIVTEYLPASHTKWQLEPIEHNPEETQKLSTPAFGIQTLKREKLLSTKRE